MKKEYLILIVLIAGLSAYLLTQQDDRVHYELPVPATIAAKEISRVEISGNGTPLTLTREDKHWTVTENIEGRDARYPADPAAMDRVTDALREVRLSALVSEAGDLVRYDLDPENGLRVQAFAGDKLLRSLVIGKAAPSYNHTYVMLGDGNEVFQADGSFRNDFDKTVDAFRDKAILSFETEKLNRITLTKDGVTRTLALKSKEENGEADPEKSEDAETTWRFDDGSQADNTAARDLIASLSRLECQSFLPDGKAADLEKSSPVCRIRLENDVNLGLRLYEQENGEAGLAGISTATPYAFTLASYKTEDILSYVDKLLGIAPKEDAEAVKE